MIDINLENDHYKIDLKYLDWDSKILDIKCGYLELTKKKENDESFHLIFEKFKKLIEKHQYKFISIKYNANDVNTVNKLLHKGALLIDTELTFLKDLSKSNIINYTSDKSIKISKEKRFWDESLYFISDNILKSRFYIDPNICTEKAKKLWDQSIYNHCNGIADYLIVSRNDNELAGLIIVNNYSNIFLIGVLPKFQNKGIAYKMMTFLENNITKISVISVETQSINFPAQSLYTKMGYKNCCTKYILHYWN